MPTRWRTSIPAWTFASIIDVLHRTRPDEAENIHWRPVASAARACLSRGRHPGCLDPLSGFYQPAGRKPDPHPRAGTRHLDPAVPHRHADGHAAARPLRHQPAALPARARASDLLLRAHAPFGLFASGLP